MTALRDDALGCDIGGTAVKLVLLRGGRAVARTTYLPPRAPSRRSPTRGRPARAFVDRLAAEARGLVGAARPEVLGMPIGVGLPGLLDARRRRPLHLSHRPELDGCPLATSLERRLRAEVHLDTDSNSGAVAEARRGAGRGARRVLFVAMGTGLGAALTERGLPVRVRHHTVGQVAHLPIAEDGPRCGCGRRGCAESLLSAPGIARRAGRHATPSAAEEIGRLADEGDREARAIWRETGELLGRLLAVLVPLWSPEVVVIGGGVSASSHHFLGAAERALRRRLPRTLRDGATLVPASLGPWAGAIGAGLLARDAAR